MEDSSYWAVGVMTGRYYSTPDKDLTFVMAG